MYFHTDSLIVLGYLSNTERRFARYVSRRIELISNMTSRSSWRYVCSENNPADLASRPQSINVLQTEMWVHGPSFLRDFGYNAEEYPEDSVNVDLPEQQDIL